MTASTMQKLLPISVLMITHRGDERFFQAIASIKWAQEVLIHDLSGTIDKNKLSHPGKIVLLKNPKTLDTSGIGNFAKIRNQLQLRATQPWIFWLDSDEVVADEATGMLASMIERSDIAGWAFQRVDHFTGQTLAWGEVGKVWLLRLGKKGALRWSGAVHEVAGVKGSVEKSKVLLHHYPHPTISEFISQISQYAEIEAQARVSAGRQWHIGQLAYPPGKWLFAMLFQQAWRDGWAGWVYATVMSLHSMAVRVFWWEKQHA